MEDGNNDFLMQEDSNAVEIRMLDETKGKGLFATRSFQEGNVIFEENPLVCCQFPWNATCHYDACDYCLRSLETAEENIRRLLKRPDFVLPHPELCITDKAAHVECDLCGVRYCCQQCYDSAMSKYHQAECLRSRARDGTHPLEQLNETWKQMNYPPETSSILIFARILALVNQANDKSAILHSFSQFCHVNDDSCQIEHKLLGENFAQQLEVLREMLGAAVGSEHTQHWLTPDGFRSLVVMVGTNGQGVGTSPLAEWARRAVELQDPKEQKEMEDFIDKLYDDIEEETGGFLNCEGSALYSLQSKINHSCEPNAEICYVHASARLTVRTLKSVAAGEELCISYLSPCDLSRSRHSRRKSLRENYVFECHCNKCEREADEPDLTSEEEISEDED